MELVLPPIICLFINRGGSITVCNYMYMKHDLETKHGDDAKNKWHGHFVAKTV